MGEKAKIMVSLVAPLIERLNKKIEAVGLRRDAYLSRLLEVELNRLDSELGEMRNSDAAKKYLWAELQKLPRLSVSIALSKSVIEKLGTVCAKHNIDRDCLINRIIFILSAERTHLHNIRIDCSAPPTVVDLTEDAANPFDRAYELITDPFEQIRQWMKKSGEEPSTFYLWSFANDRKGKRELAGLDCLIDDESITVNTIESIM